jgi:predicted DNA-binding protein (MmcQ/YjbR family)
MAPLLSGIDVVAQSVGSEQGERAWPPVTKAWPGHRAGLVGARRHTAPSFRVRDKLFVMTGEDRTYITCKAPPGVQQMLVASDPRRFFVPAYVGSKGWIGVRLDGRPDWDEIAEIVEESYRMTAPKRLAAQLDV